jgi:hypothetical protein
VNVGGQNCLQSFFAGQGNYTAYDNHELGNKQYINGGAPTGGPVGSTTGFAPFSFPTGAGVDARIPANDVTPNDGSVVFMNKSGGFQTPAAGLRELPADERARPDQRAVGPTHARHPATLLRPAVGPACNPYQYRLPQLPRHPHKDCRKRR